MGWWVKERGSVCGKNRKFLPLLVSRPVVAPPASCLWYGWGLLSLPPSVANIRHVWSCSSTTSFAFMVWWLIREGNGILWFLHELWNISQRNWEYSMFRWPCTILCCTILPRLPCTVSLWCFCIDILLLPVWHWHTLCSGDRAKTGIESTYRNGNYVMSFIYQYFAVICTYSGVHRYYVLDLPGDCIFLWWGLMFMGYKYALFTCFRRPLRPSSGALWTVTADLWCTETQI